MEHHRAEVRDNTARFLRELRQLRDGAGLGHAELAARAHYPHDSIRAAEVGPSLPDLPVLAAYVRGCGGTTEEWEERWRSLTRTPALSRLPTRAAGCSAAASAGARIGAVPPAAESPDPAVIMAALDRVAAKMSTATDAAPAQQDSRPRATVPQQPGKPVTATAPPEPAAPAATPTPAAAQYSATASPALASPIAVDPAPVDPAPVDPAAVTPAAVTPAASAGPASTATRLPLPPWILVAALVAIAVCVLAVVLAVFG